MKKSLAPEKNNPNLWFRICTCGKKILYSRYWDWIKGERANTKCKGCRSKERGELQKITMLGAGNPFYGKKHSEETLKIFRERNYDFMTGDKNPMKRGEIKDLFSKIFSGENNPMYGKSHSEETRRKLSASRSGKNNPMYGRPCPNGAGNGWANWYKGRHFRSLRELQYFINEVEGKGLCCEGAQCKRFRISYVDYNGKDRTYLPDFFIDNHWLIEIKPKNLWNTLEVKAKKEAAENFCKKFGYEYSLVDVDVDSKQLKEKYINGEIKFVEKYKHRFEQYAGILN